jgi:hypothetical protein
MDLASQVFRSARRYTKWGWSVVPVPYREKAPRLKNWQKLRLKKSELASRFSEQSNIGVLLGEASGGLVDIDIDCHEALFLAPRFLPDTELVHGRKSKPCSHYWYRVKPIAPPRRFCDVDGSCLVELRSTGQQTILPPSVHPSGERLRWTSRGPVSRLNAKDLQSDVARLAAAALIARHWPAVGSRDYAAMALAGTLLRGGWDEIEVGEFVSAVAQAAHDEEWAVRKLIARATRKRLDRDQSATGRPRLSELLGREVVDQACEWLGIGSAPLPAARLFKTEHTWPRALSEAAFQGLAGTIVREIAPQTEADTSGLLLQLLTGFGNMVGRQAHFDVGAVQHFANLFCVLVGRTAKARKGTSWAEVYSLLAETDPEWANSRIRSGLSSGEGLIWEVRDPLEKPKKPKKEGDHSSEHNDVEEAGVPDKRLLVTEFEFASPLRMIRREGNVLSAVIRHAWDRGDLATLTKNSPARATNAHISIIGHITRDELLREFSATEGSNGFANRILWDCVRRSQLLPFGGRVSRTVRQNLAKRLRRTFAFARVAGEMSFSERARRLWKRKYVELAQDFPGLLGAITSRSEAQVLRLSMIYALLGRSVVIKIQHLRAALEVWRYCEDSARCIFGDSFGDPVADAVLRNLRRSPRGITRSNIREIFSRNRSEEEISNGLRVLAESGLARFETEVTGGRPAERWFATR